MRSGRRALAASLIGLGIAAWCAPSGDALAQRPARQQTVNPIASDAPASLRSFYYALRDLEAGQRQKVTILQLGDSHTASDHFSGHLRDLFQQRFGNGGRGLMPAGAPYPYYRPYQESVSQTSGWIVSNSFRPDDPGPYGVTGYTVTGRNADDLIDLEAGYDGVFDAFDIDFLRQPGGGHLEIQVDGRGLDSIATDGTAPQADTRHFTVPKGSQRLSLHPRGDGPVSLLGWNLIKNSPGVVLAAQGFSGATVDILDRWDPNIVSWQLRRIDPSLIILAFGTNEGFQTVFDPDVYADALASRLTILRSEAPNAAILVVGPPDGERLPSWCAQSAAQKERFRCAPLTARETANYAALIKSRSRTLCRWHAPANLSVVRDIERRVANQQGAYFWDWSKVQPGVCGMDKWARAKPPLAHADRVHMQEEGYGRSAEALFAEIMHYYRQR